MEYKLPVADQPSVGTLHFIPDSDRPSSWILSGGTSTTFVDVDFGAHVPSGAKAVVLTYSVFLTGNGALDESVFYLRKKGETTEDSTKNARVVAAYKNLASGIYIQSDGQITVPCDSDGKIQYKRHNSASIGGALYLTIQGYYK